MGPTKTRLYLNSADILDGDLIRNLLAQGLRGFRMDLRLGDAQAQVNALKIAIGARTALTNAAYWTWLLHGGNFTQDAQGTQVTSAIEYLDLAQTSCESIKAHWDPFLYAYCSIELGNEPDIAAEPWKDPREMAVVSAKAWRIARAILGDEITIITPGISNLDADSIAWLKRYAWHLESVAPMMIEDPELAWGIHRYPVSVDPAQPHVGRTRAEELTKVRAALPDGARIWVTETGLTEGPHRVERPFPWCWIPKREYLTPEVVAARVASDLTWWANQPGVEVVTLYQINDGLNPDDPLHHYGIRDTHGAWKPLYYLLPAITALL